MAENEKQQSQESQGGENGTAVATRPGTKPAPPPIDRMPPWRVLLHNDDHNDMADVVRAIQRLTHMPARDAFARMLEAHTRGVAMLVETHREHAELLVEQFASFKLRVTAEPAQR
jgi:ATP-dependent Clp protease adaptor protein ClpS